MKPPKCRFGTLFVLEIRSFSKLPLAFFSCFPQHPSFGHDNDTSFMNPSSHLPLSVNQQARSSSQREARLKSSLKNVQWQLPPFLSFPGLVEHQACWTKNSYFSETTIWVQEDDTSASRNHVTDSWQLSSQFTISLSRNPPTNIQAW